MDKAAKGTAMHLDDDGPTTLRHWAKWYAHIQHHVIIARIIGKVAVFCQTGAQL
jgi:hypothetical protein